MKFEINVISVLWVLTIIILFASSVISIFISYNVMYFICIFYSCQPRGVPLYLGVIVPFIIITLLSWTMLIYIIIGLLKKKSNMASNTKSLKASESSWRWGIFRDSNYQTHSWRRTRERNCCRKRWANRRHYNREWNCPLKKMISLW